MLCASLIIGEVHEDFTPNLKSTKFRFTLDREIIEIRH